jgi:hypothetical protein
LIIFQMMRVISSPSSSTTGFFTLILAIAFLRSGVPRALGPDPVTGNRAVVPAAGRH